MVINWPELTEMEIMEMVITGFGQLSHTAQIDFLESIDEDYDLSVDDD